MPTLLYYCVYTCKYSDPKENSKSAQQAYGPSSIQSEITSTELDCLCSEYKKDLTLSKQDAQQIEEDTRQQSDDPTGMWANLRRCRLTASNFGKICKRRLTTPVASMVKTLLYQSSSLSAPSIRWGRENEENARKA